MKELYLPIKNGERPLFSSLGILETIYKDYKRGNSIFNSIEDELIIKKITEIYVFLEVLKLREQQGIRESSSDLIEPLKQIPLFFNTEKVKEWEVTKIWNNNSFIPYKDILLKYENSFVTLTPSNAYQINDTSQYIWRQWLTTTPIKDLVEVFEYSAQSLLNWNNLRVEKSALEKNIEILSKKLSINKKDAKHWYYFEVCAKSSSNIWDLYLKEDTSEHNIQNLIKIWEKALLLKKNSINSLLYDDAVLVKIGLYNLHNIEKEIKNFEEYFYKIKQYNIPNIEKTVLKQEHILNLFLNKINLTNSLPLDFFSHITGINETVNLIKKLNSGKILIYGKNLSGKKSLAQSIFHSLKMNLYKTNHKDKIGDTVEEKNIYEFKLANTLLHNFKKSVLLVENAEKKYDLKRDDGFLNTNGFQCWTISNIDEVNNSVLKKFDIIIEIKEPPLVKRIELASKFFKDKNIAVRVAQTLKEPFDIIKIGRLCNISEDFSWNNILLLISSHHNVQNNNSNKIKLNKIEAEESIIPLVGYPDMEDLLIKIKNFYANPEKYIELGAKADKGILLIGPPGTGKTHFAKNLSHKIGIPLFSAETSVIVKNIEEISSMFNELKRNAPCILFLDEIDSLIANPKEYGSTNLEKQKIVNAFLSNIEGIESNDGILIIGATHRGDNIEPAAIRSGRLSKVVHLKLPNNESRKDIWEVHLKNKKYNKMINFETLSQLSLSFSCADIKEAANKSALLAAENGKNEIELSDIEKACDETFWGYADKGTTLTEQQKRRIAYHEAGHAIIALKNGFNVQRITIRPRHNSLGAVHYTKEEGIYSMSMNDIQLHLQVGLGGICAENIIFNNYENGGVSDLKTAHDQVMHAITEAGLGKNGPINLGKPDFWSNQRKKAVEKEERKLMEKMFKQTESILNEHIDILHELTEILLQYKEISGESIKYFKESIQNNTVPSTDINYNEEVFETLHKKDSNQ